MKSIIVDAAIMFDPEESEDSEITLKAPDELFHDFCYDSDNLNQGHGRNTREITKI